MPSNTPSTRCEKSAKTGRLENRCDGGSSGAWISSSISDDGQQQMKNER